MNSEKKLLTTTELATRWRITEQTVRKWRVDGKGPPFLRIEGTIRYDEDAIREWLGIADTPLPETKKGQG